MYSGNVMFTRMEWMDVLMDGWNGKYEASRGRQGQNGEPVML